MTPLAFIAGLVPTPDGDKFPANDIVGTSEEFGALMSVAELEWVGAPAAPGKDLEKTSSATSLGFQAEISDGSKSFAVQPFALDGRFHGGPGLEVGKQSQPTLGIGRAAGSDAGTLAVLEFADARKLSPQASDQAGREESPPKDMLPGSLPAWRARDRSASVTPPGQSPEPPERPMPKAAPQLTLGVPIAEGAGPINTETRSQTSTSVTPPKAVPVSTPPPETLSENGVLTSSVPSQGTLDAIEPGPVLATRAGSERKSALTSFPADLPEISVGGGKAGQAAGPGPGGHEPDIAPLKDIAGLRASVASNEAAAVAAREQVEQPGRRNDLPGSRDIGTPSSRSAGGHELQGQGGEPKNAASVARPADFLSQDRPNNLPPLQRQVHPEQAGFRQVPLPMETSLSANLEPKAATGASAGPITTGRPPQLQAETSAQIGSVASAQAEQVAEPPSADLADNQPRLKAERGDIVATKGAAGLAQAASAWSAPHPNQLAVAEPIGMSRAGQLDLKAAGEATVTEIGALQDSRLQILAVPSPPQKTYEMLPNVIQQLSAGVHQLKDGPVEINLSPEELGRVRLSLNGSDAAMAVVIQVERPETLDLLRRHIDILAQQFRDLGYSSLSFTFEQQTQDDAKAAAHTYVEDEDGTAVTRAEPSRALSMPIPAEAQTGLDLRL